jgi:enamine deaminase RidA (YjgF/YER057c/UK114 family)
MVPFCIKATSLRSAATLTKRSGKLLAQHGAGMGDVVKLTSYVTDIRSREDLNKCRSEAFTGVALPAHTFLAISQLARPGMLVEMDVIAVAAR